MFCCSPELLHYTINQVDPYDSLFDQEPVSLKKKLKENSNEFVFPMELELMPLPKEDDDSIWQEFPQYKLTLSQQTKQLEIQQLTAHPTQKIWRVLLQNQEQELKEGDFLSFDGFQFQIYHLPKKPQILSSAVTHLSQEQDKCRICFDSSTSDYNPLLSFCKCSGSIKFMHLNCCREWVQEGLTFRKQKNYEMYVFEKSVCNICKQPWKKKIRHHKKEYFLYDIHPDQSLAQINRRDSSQDQKVQPLHFSNSVLISISNFQIPESDLQLSDEIPYFLMLRINLPQEPQKQLQMTVGMSDKCDIILEDFLLQSPIQCQISWKNSKLYIKDMNSVGGTCICMKNLNNKSFNNKDGLTIKFDNLIYDIRNQRSLFPCLKPTVLYKIKYTPFKGQSF